MWWVHIGVDLLWIHALIGLYVAIIFGAIFLVKRVVKKVRRGSGSAVSG